MIYYKLLIITSTKSSLYRLLFKLHGKVHFSDVLVADILISFSGVFTGIFIKLMENTSLSYAQFVPLVTR
jgi:hypothetical protein